MNTVGTFSIIYKNKTRAKAYTVKYLDKLYTGNIKTMAKICLN